MDKAMTITKRKTWTKVALSAGVGFLVGVAGVSAAAWLGGGDLIDSMGGSRVALAGIGLVYILIAAMTGFGVVAPQAGAKLLNVEDPEELVEERAKLGRSALYMMIAGITLVLIALARAPGFADGPVAPAVAMIAVGCLLLFSIFTYRWMRLFDELDWQIGIEGGSWAFMIAFAILLPWSAIGTFGWSAAPTPIDMLTILASSLIGGSFIVAAKRGLMVR